MAVARQSTLAFLERLPEAEILRPRTQDRWSVKDVLGHLLTCDEETVRRFALIARGRGDRIFWFRSMADADRFNARSVAITRRVSLPVVLRRMAKVHAELVERFKRLPEASLADPAHEYSVVSWLPAPGWQHEREHLAEVKAWWRDARRSRADARGAASSRRARSRRAGSRRARAGRARSAARTVAPRSMRGARSKGRFALTLPPRGDYGPTERGDAAAALR